MSYCPFKNSRIKKAEKLQIIEEKKYKKMKVCKFNQKNTKR